jgi:hypothetical protein
MVWRCGLPLKKEGDATNARLATWRPMTVRQKFSDVVISYVRRLAEPAISSIRNGISDQIGKIR